MKRTFELWGLFRPIPIVPLLIFPSLALPLFALGCSAEAPATGVPAGSTPKKAPRIEATRVEVAELVGSQSTGSWVRPGEVIAARSATLASPLGGFVESVHVKSGRAVKPGALLARIDTQVQAAQLQLAAIEVADATRELARLETLGEAVPQARVESAQSRAARARAQHRLAKTRAARTELRAPFSGTVSGLTLEKAEVVAPGQPVATLLQLDPIRVSVSVSDRDITSLTLGQTATVRCDGAPEPRAAQVVKLEPAADRSTRTFLVEVELPNPQHTLLPGMIANVAFSRREAGSDTDTTLTLPQELLVTRLSDNGVFVADKSETARWRPVSLGRVVGTEVEILSGVSKGDAIVTVGHRSLNEGDPLIVARKGQCCENGRVVHVDKAVTKQQRGLDKMGDTQQGRPPSSKPAKDLQP